MTATGFPRMPSRVFVALLIADHPLTAADLVVRLAVSPASVSKAIRYLQQLGFVARERRPGQRRERYAVDEDVWYRALTGRARTFTTWGQAARRGTDVLGVHTPAGARLDEMSEFLNLASHDLDMIIDHWRGFLTKRRQGGN